MSISENANKRVNPMTLGLSAVIEAYEDEEESDTCEEEAPSRYKKLKLKKIRKNNPAKFSYDPSDLGSLKEIVSTLLQVLRTVSCKQCYLEEREDLRSSTPLSLYCCLHLSGAAFSLASLLEERISNDAKLKRNEKIDLTVKMTPKRPKTNKILGKIRKHKTIKKIKATFEILGKKYLNHEQKENKESLPSSQIETEMITTRVVTNARNRQREVLEVFGYRDIGTEVEKKKKLLELLLRIGCYSANIFNDISFIKDSAETNNEALLELKIEAITKVEDFAEIVFLP